MAGLASRATRRFSGRFPAVSSRLRSLIAFQEVGLVLVVLVMGLALTCFGGTVRLPKLEHGPNGEIQPARDASGEEIFIERNKFLNAQSLAQLAKDTSFIGIMAVGMAVVIISGGIDLSVGAVYALAAVLSALALRHFGPTGTGSASALIVPLAIIICVGVGLLCGLVNGGLIVGLRMHPFIITLGTMAIFRGIALVASGGQSIGDFPPQLQSLVKFQVGTGLTLVPPLVMLIVTMAGWIFLRRLAAGRRVFAVGGNEVAAQYSGIPVRRVKLGVYLWSGGLAGLAGLLAMGYYGSASSGDANGYELNVVAAAVVGGASLNGGRGSAFGAMLGALIIQMITTGIIILGIDQNYSQIITGAVVIAAVVLDTFNTWLTQRRLARRTA
jgi:ribose/xylose/arabinose/galactoside ABC-type transport system permease subunit